MLKVQAVLFLLDVANLGDVDCNCDAARNRSLTPKHMRRDLFLS